MNCYARCSLWIALLCCFSASGSAAPFGLREFCPEISSCDKAWSLKQSSCQLVSANAQSDGKRLQHKFTQPKRARYTLEGRSGAFFPSSNKMRKIFEVAMPFVELEGSYQFYSGWDAWAGVGYIFAKGESIGCGNTTTIDVIPFTLGIKRFFSLTRRTEGFLGLGGLWSLYRNHDHSSSVHQHISANAFGGIVTAGVNYHVMSGLSLSFFGEYMYQHFHFGRKYPQHFTYRHDVNMSGTKVGLGIIYDF